MKHRLFFVWTVTLMLAGGTSLAWGEYPERPITLIINYSAGGGIDLTIRALAKKAEKLLGQPVIPVNKPGSGGIIGIGALATSKPDGYTIGALTYSSLAIAPHIYDVAYNPLKDFEYIMAHGRLIYGPSVRADSPFKTLKDLMQYAKANPGRIKYGVQGLSVPNNIGMIYLAKAEGIKWEPVVFKTVAEEVSACLGGHIDITVSDPPNVLPHIKAGKLRLLVSVSGIRWKWVPDVPTAKEMGYNFTVESWTGLGAPKGVPKPIMDKLREVFRKSFDDPEAHEVMERISTIPAYLSPEEYYKIVEAGYKESEAILLELGAHKTQKK